MAFFTGCNNEICAALMALGRTLAITDSTMLEMFDALSEWDLVAARSVGIDGVLSSVVGLSKGTLVVDGALDTFSTEMDDCVVAVVHVKSPIESITSPLLFFFFDGLPFPDVFTFLLFFVVEVWGWFCLELRDFGARDSTASLSLDDLLRVLFLVLPL